jgi:hypothetical protein
MAPYHYKTKEVRTMIKEEIAKKLLGIVAAATIAGYGISEMDTFFQKNNQNNLNEVKTAVETILQKPENLLQGKQEQKKEKKELILTSQFQYEYKPITKAEICSFYEDLKICKEVKKDEKETKI